MTDDIVTRLWQFVPEGAEPQATRLILNDAANEIERLRQLSDALADALTDVRRRHPCDCADGYDHRTGAAAITEWQEARHG